MLFGKGCKIFEKYLKYATNKGLKKDFKVTHLRLIFFNINNYLIHVVQKSTYQKS